jgi:uncharacterized protein (DUF1697 family)
VTARVALLRAVNVGGRNRVPMAELRSALEDAGLRNVSTVLQSGNVVFDGPGGEDAAASTIRTTIVEAFGLEVGVSVRTAAELRRVVSGNPFLGGGDRPDPATLHVAFLDAKPAAPDAARLDPERSPPDAFALRGREVYLSYPNGSGRSRLTLGYLETTLGVQGTARNWRTVERLAALLTAAAPGSGGTEEAGPGGRASASG